MLLQKSSCVSSYAPTYSELRQHDNEPWHDTLQWWPVPHYRQDHFQQAYLIDDASGFLPEAVTANNDPELVGKLLDEHRERIGLLEETRMEACG